MIITTEKEKYPITEVLILSTEAYDAYRSRLSKIPPSDTEPDNETEHLYLLTVGEGRPDGVIVDFNGQPYKGIPAIVPDARCQLDDHIRKLADYCVTEGTDNTENGKWDISYDELYYHYDKTVVTVNNTIGRMLKEELRQRDEINELIMTEDCIEITYHMEYCQNCGQGGLDGAMSLFSLMGCNLYDVHLCDTDEDHELATIVELNQNTLTDDGKAEWSDVLNAKVESIYEGSYGVQIGLSGCPAERLKDFSYMLAGYCSESEYDRWVNSESPAEMQNNTPPTMNL